MALVVEAGNGGADSEAYVSVAGCAAYAAARRLTFSIESETACEAALRVATAWIDARFRSRFPGIRQYGRAQALEWPRSGAVDVDGWAVAANIVPNEVVRATCEAAIRELATPGALSPDLERGGAIKRIAASSVEIEYAGNAPAQTVFQVVDQALARLLVAASPYSGRVVRG